MASSLSIQALYSEHHGWLKAWLRSKLGNAADAADLAQDTFLRLLGKGEALELHTPRAFLRTVARGLVIDHWRREELERAYREALAQVPEAEAPSPRPASWSWSCWSRSRRCWTASSPRSARPSCWPSAKG